MFKFLDIPPDLKEGDIAHDFELHDSQGKAFKLYEILSHKWVVIFFYPKDETPGCTAQACSFRNAYQEFKALGVEVLGISGDSAESHERFAQKQQLPYPLLSDPQGKVAKAFGVKKALGILPGRVTFVIDRDRRIQLAYSAQLQAESHQEKALEILKTKFATPQ